MRLKEKYNKEIAPALQKQFQYTNKFDIPKLTKVVINVGVGRFSKDKAYLDNVKETLLKITGQQPMMNPARKSISAFKVREGMIVGVSVTLRGQRMFDFVEKLVSVSLPRIRDFRGIGAKLVDQHGNMSIGLKESSCFPEIRADEIEKSHGLEICLTTTAKQREEGVTLFKMMGFPFRAE
ncbi:MAG TPA: 50S ribosomal protein L5 [bacterium]|nr:50S ribosomal protein L5 [bacterium]